LLERVAQPLAAHSSTTACTARRRKMEVTTGRPSGGGYGSA
jgi:hypothetical protein